MKTTLMPTFKETEQEIEAEARMFVAQHHGGEYLNHEILHGAQIKDSYDNAIYDPERNGVKVVVILFKETHVDKNQRQ